MKVVAFSDTHGIADLNQVGVGDADLCLIAGDIAPLRDITHREKCRQANWIMNEFCEFMRYYPATQFVFVAGNHDFWGETFDKDESFWPENAHYLCNDSIEICGLKIWGTPYVNPIGWNAMWAFERGYDSQKNAFDEIPEGIDVILAHTPPRFEDLMIDVPHGARDVMTGEPLYLGSVALAEAVSRVQPSHLFCGHIHTGDHKTCKIGNTKCHNVSLLNEEYVKEYFPLVVRIKSKGVR